MVIVEAVALLVHLAAVPVAVFGHALRAPMRPDAELGVAEPVGVAECLADARPVRIERHGGAGSRRAGEPARPGEDAAATDPHAGKTPLRAA